VCKKLKIKFLVYFNKPMIVNFLNDLKNTILQLQPTSYIPNFTNDTFLDKRMRKNIKQYNSTTYHGFKPFVISLKSKQLLNYISHLVCLDDKIKQLELIQDVLFDVGKKIYQKYDPHLVYTFQNEVNVVFYYNDRGIYLFNGNVMKTVTSLASFVSVEVSKSLYKRGIDIDLHFTGQFVEFDVDYEVLNYLVWRQMDCRRNTITLLYKCLHMKYILGGQCSIDRIKVNEMITSLNVSLDKNNIEDSLYHLLTGNVIKKHVFYSKKHNFNKQDDDKHDKQDDDKHDKQDDDKHDNKCIVLRRSVGVEHIKFSDDFKGNYAKYILNKLH